VPKSSSGRSSFSHIVTLILLAALLVSGLRVSRTVSAATLRTWTGGHPPTALSSPTNWAGNVAPVAGDDLLFPAGPKRKSIRNNYPNGTTFNSLNFSGSNYNLRKNSLTLTGGINTSNSTGSNQISIPLQLNGAQAFTSTSVGSTLNLNGPINLNVNLLTFAGAGKTFAKGVISDSGALTKDGSGTLTLSANNSYSGVTTVAAGLLLVNGQQSSSPVVLTGGTLGGTGRVGSITGTSGAIKPGTAAAPGSVAPPAAAAPIRIVPWRGCHRACRRTARSSAAC